MEWRLGGGAGIGAFVAALILVCAASPVSAEKPYTLSNTLSILYADIPVGTVSFTFSRDQDALVVESMLDIEEKRDSATVYERSEKRRELWRDGDIQAFTNDIVENGKESHVTAVRIGGRLAISGPNGTVFGPDGIVPATFWSIDTVERRSVFDVRTGEVRYADTIPIMPVKIYYDDAEQSARQYLMSGEINRNLYYGFANRWLGMRFLGPDARIVDYLPE